MSISASFGFRVVDVNSRIVASPLKVIDLLSQNGWRLLNDGYVSYLPIGDNDNFNWTGNKISVDELMRILEQKEKNKELIGIRMIWQDTEIGGDFLLWDKDVANNEKIFTPISFVLDGNRKLIPNIEPFKITDVNWYLTKLLPAFNQGATVVEHFTYEEL